MSQDDEYDIAVEELIQSDTMKEGVKALILKIRLSTLEEVRIKFCAELFGLSVKKKYYCPYYKKSTKIRVHWDSYEEKTCGSCQIIEELKQRGNK